MFDYCTPLAIASSPHSCWVDVHGGAAPIYNSMLCTHCLVVILVGVLSLGSQAVPERMFLQVSPGAIPILTMCICLDSRTLREASSQHAAFSWGTEKETFSAARKTLERAHAELADEPAGSVLSLQKSWTGKPENRSAGFPVRLVLKKLCQLQHCRGQLRKPSTSDSC